MKNLYIILILSILMLVGCSAQKDIEQEQLENMPSMIPQESLTSPTPISTALPEMMVTGQYVGLADNNSFEATVDGEPMVFRHENCPEFIEENNIVKGNTVRITYITNEVGQNIALAISNEIELTIADLFPIAIDTYKHYNGIGNEYAEYRTLVEFATDNKVQIKTDNTGTSTVNVYEITDDYVKKVYTESEVYDTTDYTDKVNTDEIILMTPLLAGTTWTLPNGSERSISAVNKPITTPYSDFLAVEVKTVNENSTIYDYYVVNIGHVMTVFTNTETQDEIISELADMDKETPKK